MKIYDIKYKLSERWFHLWRKEKKETYESKIERDREKRRGGDRQIVSENEKSDFSLFDRGG